MFVLTLNRKSGIKGLALVLTVCMLRAGATAVKNFIFKDRETAAFSRQDFEMKTTQQMADYILAKGYTVDLQSAQVKEVKIPKRFDAEFENFNEKIMHTDGLSLEKHKNDRVNKWTFDIVDYDVEGKTAVAALLVRKNKLIGAYIIQQPDGTAHPLAKQIRGTDVLE